MDPNTYRVFNSNLQCPKLKTRELRTTLLELNGVIIAGGNDVYTTNHVLTFSELSLSTYSSFCGTLTCFLSTLTGDENHVVMSVLNKTLTVNNITPYQLVGTIASVTVSSSSTQYTITTGIDTNLTWTFIGSGTL